jgi:hypothetical protein
MNILRKLYQAFESSNMPVAQSIRNGLDICKSELYLGKPKEQTRVFVSLIVDLIANNRVPFPEKYKYLLPYLDTIVREADFHSDDQYMSFSHGHNETKNNVRFYFYVRAMTEYDDTFDITIDIGEDWKIQYSTNGDNPVLKSGPMRRNRSL